MFYCYILQSAANNKKLYIGFTSRDPEARLAEHNQGCVDYTKFNRPWNLIYFEGYTSEDKARLRERNLKQYGSAWGHLKKRLGL